MSDAPAAPRDTDDPLSDDLETQLGKIADQLSELSSAEEVPTGFDAPADQFEPSDVNFSSSAWLLRVLQVQLWLHLDTEIEVSSAESDALQCARSLFAALNADAAERCVVVEAGILRLTIEGADCLATRLDLAVRLQQEFQQSLETLTRLQASEQWNESWEDADIEEAAPEPIKAKAAVWPIFQLAGRAKQGRLNLSPSYQRGDVWPAADAQKLIESILRGIPLPSIILLKPANQGARAVYEVVDGKQRLTSILRFMGAHPDALQRVRDADERHPGAKLQEHFGHNYKKFRRMWKQHVGESLSGKLEAEYYFPFRLAQNSPALKGELSEFAGKYYYEIADREVMIADGRESVAQVFEQASDYEIPIIEYSDAKPRQIHEVFRLYNRQGKHLNAEELRNAVYHDVDLVRLLLVASGDNPNIEALAPYLETEERGLLRDTASCLTEYGFGTSRYKRTKLLSWLCALACQPSLDADGDLIVRSTARQIDALLDAIRKNSGRADAHRLEHKDTLRTLIRDLHACLEAHSSCDAWDAPFKDDEHGRKWQELQLVASLLGVFLVGVVAGPPIDTLTTARERLLAFTREHLRPEKTQNKTQWGFIGKVAMGILDNTGIDHVQLERALIDRYGVSCLATLQAASLHYKARPRS